MGLAEVVASAARRLTLDPVHRETLGNIQEFWITLAQKGPFLSDNALATQIETIGRPHIPATAASQSWFIGAILRREDGRLARARRPSCASTSR
jgi:hypothetical protein